MKKKKPPHKRKYIYNKFKSKKKKEFNPISFFWFVKNAIKIIFKGIVHYIFELFLGFNQILRLFKFKNIYKNKKVLIIANGPSSDQLTKEKITKFKKNGNKIFAVNRFFNNKAFNFIDPDFLCLSDPNSFDKENRNLFLKRINKIKNLTVFTPILHIKKYSKYFSYNSLVGFCDAEMTIASNCISPIFPRSYVSSTTYKAIAISLWLGFKKIYIIGLDTSYLEKLRLDNRNNILFISEHSGETTKLNDYTKCYKNVSDYIFEHYLLVKHAYKFNKKRNIINLGEYSLIDAFKKNKHF